MRYTFILIAQLHSCCIHCKKKFAIFPCLAGMSLNKLSLAGNKRQGEIG